MNRKAWIFWLFTAMVFAASVAVMWQLEDVACQFNGWQP